MSQARGAGAEPGGARAVSFSVVIPAYNEAAHIGTCLRALLAIRDRPGLGEVVVVDNGSRDGTVQAAREFGVVVIENSSGVRRSISALRNDGARRTSGDVIAFLDGDMQVPPTWLARAGEFFAGGFVGALGFVDVAAPSAGWVGRTWGNRLMQGLDRVRDVGYLPGRNLFVNRSVFERVGGFDESLRTNEDKDLCWRVRRAGYRVLSVPEPPVFHLGCERGFREFVCKEFWRQGSTLAVLRERGISPSSLRHPLLSLLHLALAVLFVAAAVGRGGRAAAIAAALWVLPALALTVRKVGWGRPPGFSLPFLFLTFVRWNVAGVALVAQLFRMAFEGGAR